MYPASIGQLFDKARRQGASSSILEIILSMPQKQYDDQSRVNEEVDILRRQSEFEDLERYGELSTSTDAEVSLN